MNQCLRQAQPLQHAFGIFADPHGAPLAQAHQLQLLGNQLLSPCGINARERRVEIEHAGTGKVSGKAVVLRQVSDGPPRLRLAGIAAEDERGAVGGAHSRQQSLDECGLPCPIGPQQTEDYTAANAQRNAVNGAHLPPLPAGDVNLREVLGFDRVFGVHGAFQLTLAYAGTPTFCSRAGRNPYVLVSQSQIALKLAGKMS